MITTAASITRRPGGCNRPSAARSAISSSGTHGCCKDSASAGSTGGAEYIALWFKSIGHESWFYWYVTACVFGSLLVYFFMREPQKTSTL